MVSYTGCSRGMLCASFDGRCVFAPGKQPTKRQNVGKSARNARKDHQRPERKLPDQQAPNRKNRDCEKERVMFWHRDKNQEEKLDEKMSRNLDKAAKKAVKEAKKAQDVIIANGFTLELLAAMGGKKHD